MARGRIRSIKPEFWSDEKIAGLSHSCALFFIGLWNFCDDEGKHSWNTRELSLEMPCFRSQDIAKWISSLREAGLIRTSSQRDWLQVVNWKHQRISHPQTPKIKASDITWESENDSGSTTPKRARRDAMDRIGSGSDRIGSGSIVTPPLFEEEAIPQKEKPKREWHPPGLETKTGKTWKAYSDAYAKRYGTTPVGNATVMGQLAQLVNRLGGEEAPPVAEFYLSHRNTYYVSAMHPVGLLLRDAEKLRTEWKVGRQAEQVAPHRPRTFQEIKDQNLLDFVERHLGPDNLGETLK